MAGATVTKKITTTPPNPLNLGICLIIALIWTICYAVLHMKSLLPYIQIILSVVMVVLVLIQQTGAQVGGAFGGNDNMSSAFHTRRGLEKGLFITTIIVAIMFALSALLNLI